LKVACLEEIAYRMGFITRNQLITQAEETKKNGYGDYLRQLAEQEV